MAVQTANTLFRFTEKLDHLLDVLSNGFSPRLSRERGFKGDKRYYPMICFCDIPLSMVENHMHKYGNYGIGMTKEWGMKNGLNPVLYYNQESNLIKEFFRLTFEGMNEAHELYRLAVHGEWIDNPDGGSRSLHVDHTAEGYTEARQAFWQVFYRIKAIENLENYFKPRVGEYEIGGVNYSNYHFYDEREWRHLASGVVYDTSAPVKFDEANASNDPLSLEEKERLNSKIKAVAKNRLSFTANDIKYIIIRQKDEIIPLVNHLKLLSNSSNGGSSFTSDEIIMLTSKILTTTQIKEDF